MVLRGRKIELSRPSSLGLPGLGSATLPLIFIHRHAFLLLITVISIIIPRHLPREFRQKQRSLFLAGSLQNSYNTRGEREVIHHYYLEAQLVSGISNPFTSHTALYRKHLIADGWPKKLIWKKSPRLYIYIRIYSVKICYFHA